MVLVELIVIGWIWIIEELLSAPGVDPHELALPHQLAMITVHRILRTREPCAAAFLNICNHGVGAVRRGI